MPAPLQPTLRVAGVTQACLEAAQGDVVSPANINSPGQIVIAGSVAAVARAGEYAKQLGAKLYLDPTTIENIGRMAVVADPQGATFAIFNSKSLVFFELEVHL